MGFEKAKENEKAKDKKRKRGIEDAELVLETKHAIGAVAKKNRLEVLDRLARLGQGLSPAQRNDFKWFKEAWDARMLQGHGDNWPELFMGWTQRLLGENEAGHGNAFSVFRSSRNAYMFRWGASVARPINLSWPQWRRSSGG